MVDDAPQDPGNKLQGSSRARAWILKSDVAAEGGGEDMKVGRLARARGRRRHHPILGHGAREGPCFQLDMDSK